MQAKEFGVRSQKVGTANEIDFDMDGGQAGGT